MMKRTHTQKLDRTLRVETLESRHLLAALIADSSQSAVVKTNTVDNDLPAFTGWNYFPPGGLITDRIEPVATSLIAPIGRDDVPFEAPKLQIKTPPQHGQLTISVKNPNSFSYTPAKDFEGIDQFEYRFGEGTVQTYAVRVAKPIYAADDWFQVSLQHGANIEVLANDGANFANYNPNYRNSLRIVSVTTKSGSIVPTISKDGKSIRLEPAVSKTGPLVFEYIVEDLDGYRDTAMVTVETADASSSLKSMDDRNRFVWMNQLLKLYENRFGVGTNFGWRWNYLYGNDGFALTSLSSTGVVNQLSSRAVDSAFGNNQVAGIDENDIIESNGSFLFALSNIGSQGKLTIVDVTNAAGPVVVSELELDGWQSALHLVDNRLTVLSSFQASDANDSPKTKLTVIDVSDKARPSVFKSVEVSGALSQSRLIGDKLYLFESGVSVFPSLERVSVFSETAQEYMNRVWNQLSVGPQLSVQQFDSKGVQISQSLTSVSLETTNRLVDDSSQQLIGILVFDLSRDDFKPIDIESVAQAWDYKLLVTNNSIYFANNSNALLTDHYVSQSQIDQFSIDPIDGKIQHKAMGKVAGTIINSFSMGEYQGDLQVFSTVNQWPSIPGQWQATQNQVYNKLSILRATGSELVEIGSVSDIAPNEQIQSARFEGETAYLVTFRQIDPFFVFDVSDPTAPKIRGELKIPGYSQYLHQLDDTHVLGIGREVDEMGIDHGLKVSLFDVTDMSHPKQISNFALGTSTYSPLTLSRVGLSDHRALGVFLNRGILAIPLFQNDWLGSARHEVGVFHFDGSKLEFVGRTQSEFAIDRVMQFGDYMYSIGQSRIEVHELLHPETKTASLMLAEAEETTRENAVETTRQTTLSTNTQSTTLLDNDWHNEQRTHDVNGDSLIDSMDVLNLINFINAVGDGSTSELAKKSVDNTNNTLKRYFDVNDDQIVSFQDVLVLINYINSSMVDQAFMESDADAEFSESSMQHLSLMPELELDSTLRKMNRQR